MLTRQGRWVFLEMLTECRFFLLYTAGGFVWFQQNFRSKLKVLNFSNFTLWNFTFQLWPKILLKLVIFPLWKNYEIKKSPQLPGARRTRAWYHHGSHTPTSPGTILLGKMAYHTKQIRRQCNSKVQLFWEGYKILNTSPNCLTLQ